MSVSLIYPALDVSFGVRICGVYGLLLGGLKCKEGGIANLFREIIFLIKLMELLLVVIRPKLHSGTLFGLYVMLTIIYN